MRWMVRGVVLAILLLAPVSVRAESASSPTASTPIPHQEVGPATLGAIRAAIPASVHANAVQAQLATLGGAWSALGPAPIHLPGTTNTFAGRIISLAMTGSSLYAGTAQGGVWKTTNNGASWTPLTDSMPNLAVGSLAIDPTSSTTIYAGTGESNNSGDSLWGDGVMKSTDGGLTWTLYGTSLFNFETISALRVDPTNHLRVYAATQRWYGASGGVAVSTDGGQTWTKPINAISSYNVSDLVIDNNGNLYAGVVDGGIYYSSDHGQTWTATSSSISVPNDGQLVQFKLALAPNTASSARSSQILYTIATDGNPIMGVWRTTNGGSSWTQIATGSTPAGYESQAWYDLYIGVDPADTTGGTVYFGLTDIYKTTNGLAATPSWTNLTNVYGSQPSNVHPDQHVILFASGATYFGNDGGLWISTNGGTGFTAVNGNLNITQFYAGAVGTTNPSLIVAGSQDNGSDQTTGGSWSFLSSCGDGMGAMIDTTTNTTEYAECQLGDLQKSINSGTSWTDITPSNEAASFVSPIAMDPTTPTTIYAGEVHLWKSINSGANWSNVSAGSSLTGPVSAIGLSKTSSSTIYIGDGSGHISGSTNGGSTWTNLDGVSCLVDPTPFRCTGSQVTSLAVDPTNSQVVYATVGGFNGGQRDHIFKSINGGATWIDISTTLPDIPFMTIAVSPIAPTILYAGAIPGAYVSLDGGITWQNLGTGLPNVEVDNLVVNSSGTTVTAFTHGRGAWRIPAITSGIGVNVSVQAAAGWNMVGGNPLALWSDASIIWSFHASIPQWYHPSTSEAAGTGAWEYVPSAGVHQVTTQACTSPVTVSVQIYRFNLVGNPCSVAVSVPAGDEAFWYNPSTQSYVRVTSINPGAAAWVKPDSSSLVLTPTA